MCAKVQFPNRQKSPKIYLLLTYLALHLTACTSPHTPPPPIEEPPLLPTIEWTEAQAPQVWNTYQATLFADPFNPGALYLASNESSLYKRLTQTSDWELVANLPSPVSTHTRRALPSATVQGLIYLNAEAGLLRSVDGGRNWIACGTTFLAMALSSDDEESVVACSGTELHISSDRGLTWTGLGPVVATENAQVYDIAVHQQDPLIMLVSVHSNSWDYRGIYKSIDGGSTWQKTNRHDARNIACSPTDPNRVYYGNNYSSQTFNVSQDFGDSWDSFFKRVGGIGGLIAVSPVDPDVAVYGDAVLNITVDAGHSATPTGYSNIGDILITADGTNAIFVHSSGGVLSISLDAVPQVEVLSSGLPEVPFRVGMNNGFQIGSGGTIWINGGGGSVFECNGVDGKWRRRVIPLYNTWYFAVSPTVPGRLYSAGHRGSSSTDPNVFLDSEDYGVSWSVGSSAIYASTFLVAPWGNGNLIAQESYQGAIITSVSGGETWMNVELEQDPVVQKIISHPAIPQIICLADSGFHIPDQTFEDWTYTKTDTLAATNALLAPWLEMPVLVYANQALHARAIDGAWIPLENIPVLDRISGWCLYGDSDPALLFSYETDAQWRLGLLDGEGFQEFSAAGEWVFLAARGDVIMGVGVDGYVFEGLPQSNFLEKAFPER